MKPYFIMESWDMHKPSTSTIANVYSPRCQASKDFVPDQVVGRSRSTITRGENTMFSHDSQDRNWASLRSHIFAPIKVQLPATRVLRKQLRHGIHRSTTLLLNMLLILSVLASPFTSSSFAAA